jgi:hypothetical protein
MRSFEDLRPDSYEQAVAAHSLEQLDSLYSQIFAPGLGLKKVMETCPPWPPGSPRAGQRPKLNVLTAIFARFQLDRRSEHVFGLVTEGKQILALIRKAVKILAPDVRTEDLDAMMLLLGQEIFQAKLNGIPLSDQLPSVDRMMAREKLAQNADQVKLKEKKLKLAERKQKALEKRMEQAGKDSAPAKAVTKEDWEEMERKLKLL